MMIRIGFLITALLCAWIQAEDQYGTYELGEGNEIVVTDGVIIREVPVGKGKRPMIAVGTKAGYNYMYDPNDRSMEGIWTGHFGRQDPAGQFEPMNQKMKSFHLKRQPWIFSEPLRLKMKLKQDHKWVGVEVVDGKVYFKTILTEAITGMRWEIKEHLEYISELEQNIHFDIKANKKTKENLNYKLTQVPFRRLSTNGKQNQRNGLKNLFPNQEKFTISFLRRGEKVTIPNGYTVEKVDLPKVRRPFLFEPTDIAFADDGSAYISTRTGVVWKNKDGKWILFADGLQEVNGVLIAPDGKGVYVMQKPELTLLKDTDGDDIADVYESVEDRYRYTGNYHEFVYGPRMDSEGNLYFSTGLAARGYHQVKGDFKKPMSTSLGYRGWVMKVDKGGNITPYASGLRSPAGIGMNDQDELFVTDNQGDWVASSYLGHVEKDDFLGHPAALWDLPEYGLTPSVLDYKTSPQTVPSVPELDQEKFAKARKHPAVWLSHGDLTNSPGHPAFAPAEGFGPFGGQAFIADIAQRNVVRVSLEKVGGAYQGAVYPFIRPLSSAAYSAGFDKKGNLWIGSVGRGWVAGESALEVIRYKEGESPFEIHHFALTKDGFDIVLTQPMAEKSLVADAIKVREYDYKYWDGYGSEPMHEAPVPVKKVSVSDDGLTVSIELDRKELFIYQIELPKLKSKSGLVLENNYGVYTLNKLLP
ncbi:hypothetical protein JIN77_02840 [Verrucomicrobiaceae bacterium R5-34]|nr:hypothetical protein [Verrucomicrobiaceae bacterium R5-34]